MSAPEELAGWLFMGVFALGSLAIGGASEARRRRRLPGQPWSLLEGLGGLLLWIWLSTGLTLLGVRLAAGTFFPEEVPLAAAVGATALAGVLSALFVLRTGGLRGLGLRRAALPWCGLALLLLPLVLGASSLWVSLLSLLGVEPEAQDIAELFLADSPLSVRLGLGLYALLVAPLVEELLLRGLLLPPLARRVGGPLSVGITAVLFGLLHLSDPQSVPPLIILGAALAWLRLRSESLWPSIVLHVANNSAALGVLLLLEAP